jgi:indolepyruvate ferredoxin oxidoreductase
VNKVITAEQEKTGSSKLAEAVARYYAKLLAYKDEYEVARLYTDGAFLKKIEGMFEGDYQVNFHLAPPLLAKPDPQTGEPRKMQFGPWMMGAFKVLAKLKGLRGTAFDLFGRTEERRMERALIGEYEATVDALLQGLTRDNHALAVEIATLPESIRGYGHIKAKSAAAARQKRDELLARYRAAPVRAAA